MNIEWLTQEDVVDIYKISKSMQSKLRMASSNSGFPFYKMGAKIVRYDRAEIDTWVKTNSSNFISNISRQPKQEQPAKVVKELYRLYGDLE